MTDETIAIGPYPEGLGYSRAPRAAARHMLRPLTRLRLAGWGLFACSMFVPPLLQRSGVVGWQGTASAPIITGAALCGLVLIIVEMLLRRRWAARAMAAHYTPGGALSLDGEGAHFTRPGLRHSLFWSHVDAVERVKDMLVIRSGMSYLPVPLSALPEGMSPEALQARIEGHVAAAKVF